MSGNNKNLSLLQKSILNPNFVGTKEFIKIMTKIFYKAKKKAIKENIKMSQQHLP